SAAEAARDATPEVAPTRPSVRDLRKRVGHAERLVSGPATEAAQVERTDPVVELARVELAAGHEQVAVHAAVGDAKLRELVPADVLQRGVCSTHGDPVVLAFGVAARQ